jgi:hypothetical protein
MVEAPPELVFRFNEICERRRSLQALGDATEQSTLPRRVKRARMRYVRHEMAQVFADLHTLDDEIAKLELAEKS